MLAVLVLAVACAAGAQSTGGTYLELWKQGRYHEALDEVQRRMALYNPNRIPSQMRFHHAELLFATGQVAESIDAYKFASKNNSEPEYLVALADAHDYLGQPMYRDNTLRRVATLISGRRWQFSVRPGNLVAVARVHEWGGEPPKSLLNTFYAQVFDRFPSSSEAYVGAGELALRYAGYGIAAKHFEKALELDPEDQDALAGLCETLWRSGDPRLNETIERFIEINPNHPRLLALQVQLLLDGTRFDEGMELIARGLEINPNDLDLLAYKAAVEFMRFDYDAHAATVEQILAFNPIRSQALRTIGQVVARHYRFEDALAFQARALELNTKDHEARAEYTLNLMRLGREQEGREELQRAFDANPYNVSMFNMLKLMDTLEEFAVIETGDFILKMPKSEAPVLTDAALALLEEAVAKFEADYDMTMERPVLIELFDQHDDFMVRSVGLPGNVGHLGICFGKVVTMDTPSVRPPGSSNWEDVLWHEFMHVISIQKTNNLMPRWLSEGISVFEEERRHEAWRNRLDPQFAGIIANEDLPGVADITNYFIKPASGAHLMFGYFISGEFVKFYVDTYGFDALVDALDRIGNEEMTTQALVNAAAVSESELNTAFHDYLDDRLSPYNNIPKPAETAQAAVAAVDSPFTDALQAARDAIEQRDWAAAEKALLRAYDLFPDYNAPDAPLRQLAAIYQEQGRTPDRIAMLERQLLASPSELGTARELSEHYAGQEAWDDVARVTEWLMGIDPYDVSARRRLVQAYRALDEPDRALTHLAVATHLDPSRSAEQRLLRAELLADADRKDEAHEALIRLLEELPHYWDAQRLLLRFVESPEAAPEASD